MTAQVTPENEWAGANLRALRGKRKQKELYEPAGISREIYIGLEKGRRTITMTYAERLAPLLEVSPQTLLPPPAPREPVDSPLDRLAALEERVEKSEESRADVALDLVARLGAVEAALGIAAPPSTRQESGREE